MQERSLEGLWKQVKSKGNKEYVTDKEHNIEQKENSSYDIKTWKAERNCGSRDQSVVSVFISVFLTRI